jgi:hypothetical protein
VCERIREQDRGNVCDLVSQFAGDTGLVGQDSQRSIRGVLADQEYPGLRLRVDLAYQVLVAILDRIVGRMRQLVCAASTGLRWKAVHCRP